MARFNQLFAFEASAVAVGNSYFEPLRDAAFRWFQEYQAGYSSTGRNFRVLYHLNDERFIALDYCCCTIETRRWLFWTSELAIGAPPSRVRILESSDAVKILVSWQVPIPEQLRHFLVRQFPDTQPAPPVVRPLSHWANLGFLARENGLQAHEVQPLELLDEVIAMAVECVQQVRLWADSPAVSRDTLVARSDAFCWKALGAMLFRRFRIAPAVWWGGSDTVPPATIGLHQFPWKPTESVLVAAIEELQALVEPTTVILFILSSFDTAAPTQEERRLATEHAISNLSSFEAAICRLRISIAAIETAIIDTEVPESETTEPVGPARKRPSEKAMNVYRIWIAFGGRQEDVADLFTKQFKQPMSQGQVSRHLVAVEAWLRAGNILPPVDQSPPPPIIIMSPEKLDLGARQDGQTPRQREQMED